jgi:hypothetical protein
MICAALLGAGLLALLLLNTAVAQDSFGLQRLQDNVQQLADQKQALVQANDLAASPAQLSTKAWALGLVPASGTAFLELPSGKVVGVANPAPRATPPTVITSTSRTGSTSSPATASTTTTTTWTTTSDPGTAPGLAPAGPVSATAVTGTAPPALAPAGPKTSTTSVTSTKSPTKKPAKSTTPGTH